MVTVNGYTAERMAEIEANSVVSGEVVGDDLILTKHSGATMNAGHVKGDPGPVDLEEWLDYADPPGTPKAYEYSVLPARHGWCDALVEFDGDTYPKLAAIFGVGGACVNGACADGNFRLPNHRGRFWVARDSTITAFDTLRETGGSKDAVVVSHTHTADQAAHDHAGSDVHVGGVDHTHADGGAHQPTIDGDDGDRIAFTHASTHATVTVGGGDATAQEVAYGHIDAVGNHQHGGASAYTHDHGITIASNDPAISISTDGVSGTDKNLPPYRVVNVIMRLA